MLLDQIPAYLLKVGPVSLLSLALQTTSDIKTLFPTLRQLQKNGEIVILGGSLQKIEEKLNTSEITKESFLNKEIRDLADNIKIALSFKHFKKLIS